jgi:Fe-S-cluster-containing dehydrogenase component
MGLKRLFIDIPALLESGAAIDQIDCEYMFHRKNQGPLSLLEVAEFAAYCRQCEDAFCVAACPKEALERQENGTIKRYNMRCVGCKSCALACPFGTLYPEVLNYVTSKCDLCLNQLRENPDYIPACVKSAPEDTFMMKEIEQEDPENHIYFSGEHLVIKSPSWRHKEDRV